MAVEPVLLNPIRSVLNCAWLINPDQPPKQNVRVTIEQGLVTDLSPVPADERSSVRPIALLPRFVNAHTHLEFSDLSEPLPPPAPFPDWIRSVIRHRVARSQQVRHPATAIQRGWQESVSCGVDLVGEITTSEAGCRVLIEQTGDDMARAVSFRELIGFTADRIVDQSQLARQHLQAHHSHAVIPGLSPHAPYSVHPDIVDAAAQLACTAKVPVAMHLAETRDEIQLLKHRTGPFVDFLKSMNLWDDSVLTSVSQPLDYLDRLAQAPHALAVHGNYFCEADVQFLQKNRHVAVVYCPRTHAWFGHPRHPWQQMRAAGATVILGTDSRASNPDLSIWAELQHVTASQRQEPLWKLLPMITTIAASALDQRPTRFTIAVGQPLRAVEIACPCSTQATLNEHLMSSNAIPL
ncbi:MAG: amidohydrolase family protein [Planctomycetaceae bacterium]